jgi:hypothetical protein
MTGYNKQKRPGKCRVFSYLNYLVMLDGSEASIRR